MCVEQEIDTEDYGENVGAISYVFFRDQQIHEEITDKVGGHLGGYGGILNYIAEVSKVFTVNTSNYIAGEDYDWYELIEYFADQIIEHLLSSEIPREKRLNIIFEQGLEKFKL